MNVNVVRVTPANTQVHESMESSQLSRFPVTPIVSSATPGGRINISYTNTPRSTDGDSADAKLWELFVMLRTPFLFTVSFIILESFAIVYFLLAASYQLKVRTFEYDEWGSCVLNQYNGTDNSWVPSCGLHPPRISMKFRMWAVLVTFGQSIFVSIIAAPSTIRFIQILYQAYKRRMR